MSRVELRSVTHDWKTHRAAAMLSSKVRKVAEWVHLKMLSL